MWSHEKQMEFERAKLAEDKEWFSANWPLYQEEMAGHALMTFPVFQWNGFRAWLKNCLVGRAQELYQAFEQMKTEEE